MSTSGRGLTDDARRALLKKRLEQEGLARASGARIRRRSASEGPIVSFGQERLWLLEQFSAGRALYNMCVAVRLEGELDAALLRRCLLDVARRHEVLRWRFDEHQGSVRARVAEPAWPVLDEVVLGQGEQQDRRVLELVALEDRTPFNLAEEPPVRGRLVRLGAQEHALLLTMHHLVSDGWSVAALIREILTLYGAGREGRLGELPALPLQFGDFAAWQREALSGAAGEKLLAWWKDYLAGTPDLLTMALDRQRPERRSYETHAARLRLGPEVTARLHRLCQDHRCTPFVGLLAGFGALLARYTGQDDFVIGTPTAGRSHVELEPLIGFFINSVPMRVGCSPDQTFAQVLELARGSVLGALEHQTLPFDRLVKAVAPVRTRVPPVYQAWFVLQNAPAAPLELPGLKVSLLSDTSRAARVDVMVDLAPRDGGYEGSLILDADLFRSETAEQMARHLVAVYEAALSEPGRGVGELSLLDSKERRLLIEEHNPSPAPGTTPELFHQSFERRTLERPQAEAVVGEGESVTYLDLNRRANGLARALRALGVGPESPVPVLAERSVGFVAAVLGVLKAGGAYVPIDPAFPDERVRLILEDLRARVLVTTSSHRQRVSSAGVKVLLADELATAGDDESAPRCMAHPENLAYVIYTSGSTGRPKGVGIEHRQLAHYVDAILDRLGLGPGASFALVSTVGADLGHTALFPALASGGTLHVLSDETVRSAALMEEYGKRHAVDVMKIVPSHLEALLQGGAPEHVLPKRCLVVGGEATRWDLVGRVRALAPGTALFNHYGPTETTVGVTTCRDQPGRWETQATKLPLGRANPRTRLYVVDRNLEPTPLGVPGELLIGGQGVARGYLGQPDLTAERFIPDPFPFEPGARVYRSGDLVRRLHDGTLEFLGRVDDQLKVRGYRVEPAETAIALARHPSVEAAFASVRELNDQPALVAWYVPRPEAPAEEGLIEWLQLRLPPAAVPRALVKMTGLPLTANGKIDRKALPAPVAVVPVLEARGVPQNATEERLSRIVADVLGLPSLGTRDNFFGLGGDSIHAIQVVARAGAEGLRLRPRDIFEHQTVAELAACVSAEATVAPDTPAGTVAPLLPAQRRYLERGLEAAHDWNPAVAVEARRPLELAHLRRALEAIATRQDALRLRLRRRDGEWVQECGSADLVVEERALPSGSSEAPALVALLEELQGSLSHTGDRLARALWVTGAGGRQWLLVAFHRLVMDGVSLRLFFEDLERAYMQAAAGAEVRVEGSSASFLAWAEALDSYARGGGLAAEAAYWLDEARAGAARLPGEPRQSLEGTLSSFTTRLSVEDTRRLVAEGGARLRARVDELLLAALGLSLREWTGGSSWLVELEGHGREAPFASLDVSRTYGWFSNSYPSLLRVPSGAAEDVLREVRSRVRGVPNRGLGYGLLRWGRHHQETSRRLAQLPEAEVSLNYRGRLDPDADRSALFALVQAEGPTNAPRTRGYRLELVGQILQERLELSWLFDSSLERAAVEQLAERCERHLRALIEVAGQGGWVAVPGDFPLAKVSAASLERLRAVASDAEDLYRLSPIQQGILLESLRADSPDGVYLEQLAFTLEGPVELAVLRRAWAWVVERHPMLRSSFHWEGLEEPLQVVHRDVALAWQEEDWRGDSAEAQEDRFARLLVEQRRKGFALDRAPLMDVTVVRLGEERWRVLWNRHHLLVDGWCTAQVVGEVLVAYEALARGAAPGLPAPGYYRDYVGWLAQPARDLSRAEAFWKSELAGLGPPTPLPGSSARKQGGFATLHERVDAGLSARVQAFARESRVTVATVLQGAWALLLGGHAGGEGREVVFGVTSSGRPAQLPRSTQTVGPFLATLPMRVGFAPGPLGAWLEGLQQGQARVREYEFVPLARVQAWVGRSGEPLFQTLFVFENQPVDPSAAASSKLLRLRLEEVQVAGHAHYPLSLVVAPGESLELRLSHSLAAYGHADANRVLEAYVRLLTELCADAARDVRALLDGAVASVARGRQLRAQQSDESPAARGPRTTVGGKEQREQRDYWEGAVHEQVEARAKERPEAVAVSFEGRQVKYRQLEARANQLARLLVAKGVGRGDRVGLWLERTVDVVVAMLGVLKAGAAYVPADVVYPDERVGYMFEDAGVKVVVTHSALEGRLLRTGRPRLCLDKEEAALASQEQGAPGVKVGREDLAYVIYTSGSTGKPKGVLVTHGNVSRLFGSTREWYGFGEKDVWTMFHSPAFDVSVWEVWGALTRGGRLVVPPYLVTRNPEAFAELLYREKVTVLCQTPSAFRQLVPAEAKVGKGPEESALRWVIFAGEALELQSLRPWFRRHGDEKPTLVNMYGITETTVHSTFRVIREADLNGVPGSVIGVPLPDLELRLLDEEGERVAEGMVGEIYVGGEGVARGYLGKPELTAERFVPDPWAGKAGARMYRSGDLARQQGSGELEYLGRLDFQVKLRGFRVELGEIESALGKQEEVRECAVVVKEGKGQEKKLVAYLVCEGEGPKPAELRKKLLEDLPEYMVPSAFVRLARLPLTSNGKLDRRALPEPDEEARATEGEYEAPEGPLEEALAGIWAEVLGVQRVSRHDDFFALGGDSIIGLQVVARARAKGLSLHAADVFEQRTVAALAQVAARPRELGAPKPGSVGALPQSPIQLWRSRYAGPNPNHFNQAVMLAVAGDLDLEALSRALEALVAHHDILRLRVRTDGSQEIVEPGDGCSFALEDIDLSRVPAARRAAALEAHCERTQRGLNLAAGPVLRVIRLQWGAGLPTRLLLVAHHFVIDGVSWRILLEDLQASYECAARGDPIRLPEKTDSVRAWTARLWGNADSSDTLAELLFWASDERRAVKPLPVDNSSAADLEELQRELEWVLSPGETRSLLADAHAAYGTRTDDLLLAALGWTVGEWSGQPNVLVNLESHGRTDLGSDVDLSRTVGWLTCLYPALVPAKQGDAASLIKATKEALRAVPRGGMGYGLLRYGGAVGASVLAHVPEAELSFNNLGRFDQVLTRGRFAFAKESVGSTRDSSAERPHRLDLTCYVDPDGVMRIRWAFGAARFRSKTVRELGDRYVEALRQLLAHCTSGVFGYTPTDFPLARLSQRDVDFVAGATPDVEDLLPVGPLQIGMLLHSASNPSSTAYLHQVACDFRGELDVARLRRAWERLIQRHPALRTCFRWTAAGEPRAVVLRAVPLPWLEEDLRTSPDPLQAAGAVLARELARGFDVASAPLMRLYLLRTGDRAWRFAWQHHHAIFDGWSLSLLLQELFAVYDGLAPGVSADSPRDYARWLEARNADDAARHWQGLFENLAESSVLPYALPPTDADGVVEREWLLSEPETRELTSFARSQQLTLNTVFAGAWGTLLARHGNAHAAVFGITVAGRPPELPAADRQVGMFIQTMPVRVRLDAHSSMRELLRALQAQVLDSQPHAYAGLAQIQRWAELAPDLPLIPSLLVFENYPGGVESPGLGFVVENVSTNDTTDVPLLITVFPGARLRVQAQGQRRFFDEAALDRVLAGFATLVRDVVRKPADSPATLEVVPEAERRRLLEVGRGPVEPQGEETVGGLVVEPLRAQPSRTAATSDEGELSCGELDRRSEALAHRLLSLGLPVEAKVGFCAERSLEVLVAALGILRAGCAYVPLDPSLPSERLRGIADDAGLAAVVVPAGEPSALGLVGARRVTLGRDDAVSSTRRREVPPEATAVVLYTSGSTGRPKGVELSHRSLARYLRWANSHFEVGHGDTVLMLTALGFDGSLWELLGTVAAGARAHFAAPGEQLDPVALVDRLRRKNVTVLQLSPSLLQQLIEVPDFERCSDLRAIICAGEVMPAALPRRLRRRRPATLHNSYGPTEACVDALSWRCDEQDRPSIPVGFPAGGREVFVLDRQQSVVPWGAVGELYVAGSGTARGYLGQAALTSEHFLPCPFGAPGRRMYRTGDLVRILPDGAFEFCGRRDGQLKVRGVRVEVAEVERVLGEHPGVSQAAVVGRADLRGETTLVAFWVARGGAALTTRELRQHLAQTLPSSMVPGAFAELRALPLGPTGKVDRQALARLAIECPRSEAARVAPRDERERTLCEVLREVLRTPESLGIEDDFFDLGGNSLKAMQVATLARTRGVALRPAALLERRTVAALVRALDTGDEGTKADGLLVPLAAGRLRPLVLVHPQGGGVSVYRQLADAGLGERALFGLRAFPGDLVDLPHLDVAGVDTWQRALVGAGEIASVSALAARYLDELRRQLDPSELHLGGWSLGGLVAQEMARQLELEGRPPRSLVLVDPAPPTLADADPGLEASDWETFRGVLSELGVNVEDLKHRSESDRLKSALDRCVAARAASVHVTPALLASYLALMRTFDRLLVAHRCQRFGGKALLLWCAESARTRASEAWKAFLSPAGLVVKTVEGTHQSMLRAPHVSAVGSALASFLAEAEE